jgi:hypothetical protein
MPSAGVRHQWLIDVSDKLVWDKRGILVGCTCRYEWRSLGVLYRINLGKGWLRMDDDPRCPHHARKPQ